MGNEEDVLQNKGLYVFGIDVLQIPCFRKSFLYGICTGIVSGLVCFMGTSKPVFSTNVAFASIWIGVLAVWFPCRYKIESEELLRIAIEEEKRKQWKKSHENPSEN